MDTEVAVYRESVLEELAPLVNTLRHTLGVGIVARVAGVTETRAVHQYRRASEGAGAKEPDLAG